MISLLTLLTLGLELAWCNSRSSGPHGPGFLNFFGVFDDVKATPISQSCLARGILFSKLLISQTHLLGVPVHYASPCMEERPNHTVFFLSPLGRPRAALQPGIFVSVLTDGSSSMLESFEEMSPFVINTSVCHALLCYPSWRWIYLEAYGLFQSAQMHTA